MLSNRKFYLYISVMSFWVLMLSSMAFPYRLHTPSGVWDPIGSTPYPAPARVSNTHPGPFIHWDTQTITFKKNSSGTTDIAGTAEFAQINAAFWAWDGVQHQTIDFTDGGTTSATYSSSDGQNVVFWSNDINDSDNIGVTLITYADRFNPRLIDVDIALNADYTWTTGAGNYNNVVNVKAIVIHEVGHLLGLGHTNVNNNQIVMHARNQTSTLAQDDKDGLRFLYGSTLKVPQTFQSVREALEFASGNQTVEVKSGSSVKLIGVQLSNVATINVGVTLDVKSGATILFGPSQQLRVYGSLNADGTSSNPIKFKRRTTNLAWHSIFIDGGKLLTFDWCEVDGASNAGLRFDNPTGTVSITNSKFKNCTYDGIRFDSESLNSPPSINSCTIFNNGDAGIQISNADTVIRNTDIYDNDYGVHVTGNSQPDLGSSNNGDNNIYNNSVWDLYVTSSSNFKAEGNYWGTSTPEDVIYHGNDNASYGTVDFTPFSTVLAAPPLLVKFPVNPNPATVAIPTATAAYQNFPNPFNPETWMPYDLAEEAEVTITIYNTSGNIIRTLSLGIQPAGKYTSRSKAAYWNGRSDTGELVSSGVYFYRLKAGDYHAMKKLLILK